MKRSSISPGKFNWRPATRLDWSLWPIFVCCKAIQITSSVPIEGKYANATDIPTSQRMHHIVLRQVDLKRHGKLDYGHSGYYYHYDRYNNYYQS